MKKNRLWGIAALAISLVMILGALIAPAGADSVVSEDEISAIVNTTTDQALVQSPFTQVAAQVRNSVVGINNYQTVTSYYGYGFGYGSRQSQSIEQLAGTGSGVVVTKYGHVLTNYHVVEDATRLTVTVAGEDKEYAAVVVGYDADQDIAVLQVSQLNIPPVTLGDSDALQVGEWAIVIGNPLGEDFARTVTVGVVSALDRELEDTNYDRYGRRYTTTNTMIQVDAAINSGNSGGGMFNVLGQLQGIPARKYANSGFYSGASVDNIGFCIPVNVAKPLIEEVLRSYDGSDPAGESSKAASGDDSMLGRPRLGVSVYSLSSAVTEKLPLGAFVSQVEENSPASEGGIQVGDVIVAIDDETCSSSNAMVVKLQEYKEGDEITVKVYRAEGMEDFYEHQDLSKVGDGEYIDLKITLRVIDNVTM